MTPRPVTPSPCRSGNGKDDSGNDDAATDATISVTITVTDVNEPPVITGPSRKNYQENGADKVATYNATDPEGATNLTWSLAGDDAGDFHISNTGVLTFAVTPNFEAAADEDTNNVYLVTVEASDGTVKGALDVTVTVTDKLEQPLAPGKPAVSRNSTGGLSVNWSAPVNTGRPLITDYQYQYKKTDDPDWSGQTHSTGGPATVVINSVEAGKSYDVQVRAINDEGPGAWSPTGVGENQQSAGLLRCYDWAGGGREYGARAKRRQPGQSHG